MPGFESQLSHLQAVWSGAAWLLCASFPSSGSSSWEFSEWMYENHYKRPSRQPVLRAWTIIIIIIIAQNEQPVRRGNTAPENAFVSLQLDAFLFWTNSHSNYILIHIHCRTMQRMLLLGSVGAFETCTSEAHICFLSGTHSSSGWTEEITNSQTCTV